MDYDAPYEMIPPPNIEVVPFGRSRNRKTMQEYDFLLLEQINNSDGTDWAGDPLPISTKQPQQSNDHASLIFESEL